MEGEQQDAPKVDPNFSINDGVQGPQLNAGYADMAAKNGPPQNKMCRYTSKFAVGSDAKNLCATHRQFPAFESFELRGRLVLGLAIPSKGPQFLRMFADIREDALFLLFPSLMKRTVG
jgi:hypothetical protein